MADPLWDAVATSIVRATGKSFHAYRASPVSGGCINRAFHLRGEAADFFVKVHAADALSMFEAEAAGLQEIAATRCVRVPSAICTGSDDEHAWIVLEYLPLSNADARAMATLGERLAAMHRITQQEFGWSRDNTIGSTPQCNGRVSDWNEFWGRHRLGYQLQLAARNGYRGDLERKGALLLSRLPAIFAGHRPAASLVHGDLWSGNVAAIGGEPVIFDPAVYYGDREVDLAMTRLFGAFSNAFYRAYESVWPLESGHRERRDVYNLYHVLNHLNLFGGGYLQQAAQIINRLLEIAR